MNRRLRSGMCRGAVLAAGAAVFGSWLLLAAPAEAGFIDVLGVTLKNKTGGDVFAYQLALKSNVQPAIQKNDFAYFADRRPAGWVNRPVDQVGALISVGWTGNIEGVPKANKVKLPVAG